MRLILDGTVVRVRLDRDLAAGGHRRACGQSEVLLAIESISGESTEAERAVLDDLIQCWLRRPEFLTSMVRRASRLRSPRADGVPVQGCSVH